MRSFRILSVYSYLSSEESELVSAVREKLYLRATSTNARNCRDVNSINC
jgi:hypothetical protein